MPKKSEMQECMYKDSIPNLKAGMDYIKENLAEMKADLKAHIASEDEQFNIHYNKIEKIIVDWQKQHDKDSKDWRSYAETTFVKRDSLKLAGWVIGTFVTAIGVIVTAINFIHPLFGK